MVFVCKWENFFLIFRDANNFELDSGHPLLPPQRIHFKLSLEDAVEIGRAEEKLERF